MNIEPKVTFVVPCYKLAHLLPECIQSILNQTYTNFEIIVMDDCSPDETAQAVQLFQDPRITYVRNEVNLGHLRNYNKGIGLARGEYVWLISADDKLRQTHVLDRYVAIMDAHPRAGYIFSSGVFLEGDRETRLIEDSWWGKDDFILEGKTFFERFYRGEANIVCPSCMVRKDCYQRVSMFPLDMPHAGDRYLWSLWSLSYDVAYCAEPMVGYRLHQLNIMKALKGDGKVTADLINWQTRIRHEAEATGCSLLVKSWISNVSNLYVFALLSARFQTSSHCISFDEFEASLAETASGPAERRVLRASVYAGFADGCYRHESFEEADRFYLRALAQKWFLPRVWAKLFLVRTGRPGTRMRRFLSGIRDGRERNPATPSEVSAGQ